MGRAKETRAVLIGGKAYRRMRGGRLAPLADESDYARIDGMSATEVERLARTDRDGSPMTDEEWLSGEIRQTVKVPVGLKLDDDVLRWFKGQGRGYQTRINAILRRYMQAQQKAS